MEWWVVFRPIFLYQGAWTTILFCAITGFICMSSICSDMIKMSWFLYELLTSPTLDVRNQSAFNVNISMSFLNWSLELLQGTHKETTRTSMQWRRTKTIVLHKFLLRKVSVGMGLVLLIFVICKAKIVRQSTRLQLSLLRLARQDCKHFFKRTAALWLVHFVFNFSSWERRNLQCMGPLGVIDRFVIAVGESGRRWKEGVAGGSTVQKGFMSLSTYDPGHYRVRNLVYVPASLCRRDRKIHRKKPSQDISTGKHNCWRLVLQILCSKPYVSGVGYKGSKLSCLIYGVQPVSEQTRIYQTQFAKLITFANIARSISRILQ